jgi:hypothetical protein
MAQAQSLFEEMEMEMEDDPLHYILALPHPRPASLR